MFPYLLQAPPEQDLSRSLAVLLHQVLQRRLIHAGGLDQRRVGLDHHVALPEPLAEVGSSAPRVQFILADGDLTAAALLDVVLEFLEVADAVVGNSDRTNSACLLSLDQDLPRAQTALSATVGTVDQHTSHKS